MEMETLAESIEDVTVESKVEDEKEIKEVDPITVDGDIFLQEVIESFEALSDPIQVVAAPAAAAASPTSIKFNDNDNIYTLNLGNRDYRVMFPADAQLVVRDGVLINMSAAAVTGVVLANDDSSSLITYHEYFLTLYPFTNTNGNNNLYRYQATAYLTRYTPSTNTSLATTVTYVNPYVTQEKPLFRGFSSFQLIMMLCAALLVLIQFFGGIFRR